MTFDETFPHRESGSHSIRAIAAACLVMSLPGCFGRCVQRCQLDPVEQDLNRFKEERAKLSKEHRKLSARIKEFEDKVFVNQPATLDLLKADLTRRCRQFVARLSAIKVKTKTVGKILRTEVQGYQELARAYAMLQDAFEREDNSKIREGLKMRQKAMQLIEKARSHRLELRRKYTRHRRRQPRR